MKEKVGVSDVNFEILVKICDFQAKNGVNFILTSLRYLHIRDSNKLKEITSLEKLDLNYL